MKSIDINGSLRKSLERKNTQLLREQGNVICVLYGGKEQVHFSAPELSFRKLIYTPEVHTVALNIDGKEYKAVLQDIQLHPVTDRILHIDFLELSPDKPVIIDVPVKITGSAIGVKQGGKMYTKIRKLKIKALPDNLPDFVEIKADNLDIGKSIRVADISIKGVEILNAPNNVIVSVKIPRKVAETEPAKAEATPTDAATTPAAPAPAKA